MTRPVGRSGRRSHIRAAWIACVALVSIPSAAADVRVLGVDFEPSSFLPGDPASAVVRFDPMGIPWIEDEATSGLPAPEGDGPVIASVRIERRSGAPALVVSFTAWKPGPGRLPPLSVGGLSFPPLLFEASSALSGGDRSAPSPLPQLEPPGLRRRVYLTVGSMLILLLASILAVTRLRPWLTGLAGLWERAVARRRFESVLEYLEKTGGGGPDAWAVLCGALRRYAGAKSGLDWSPLTASEAARLPSTCLPGGARPLADVLAAGDRVRFAGRPDEDLGAALATARAVVERVESGVDEARGQTPGGLTP